jgi:hypothetical protein
LSSANQHLNLLEDGLLTENDNTFTSNYFVVAMFAYLIIFVVQLAVETVIQYIFAAFQSLSEFSARNRGHDSQREGKG